MATKYLDYQGLQYLWNKIKKYVGDGVGSIFAWQKVTGANAEDPTSSTTYTAGADSNTLQFVSGDNIQTTVAKDVNSGAIKITTKTKDVVTNVNFDTKCGNLTQTINGKATNIAHATTIVDAGKSTAIIIGDSSTTGSAISKERAFNAFQVDRDFVRKDNTSCYVVVIDKSPQLEWGQRAEVACVAGDLIHVVMPENPNTDTQVTCANNHYVPSTFKCWNSCDGMADPQPGATVAVVTGVQTDERGHVTLVGFGQATDTRNTAGSTEDSGCLFIVGAKSQGDHPQTYSNSGAYIKNGKVYTGGVETVSLTAEQTLTNKTLTNGKASSNPVSSSNDTTLATTKFVKDEVAAAQTGSATFKGAVLPTNYGTQIVNYKNGWYWLVKTPGTFAGLGELQAGDLIYAIADGSEYNAENLTVVQANLDPMTSAEIDDATDQTPNAG